MKYCSITVLWQFKYYIIIIICISRIFLYANIEHVERSMVRVVLQSMPDDVHNKCIKLSAAVKGYLTRQLFKSDKVQSIIKTIWVSVTAYLSCIVLQIVVPKDPGLVQ